MKSTCTVVNNPVIYWQKKFPFFLLLLLKIYSCCIFFFQFFSEDWKIFSFIYLLAGVPGVARVNKVTISQKTL